MEEQMYDDLRPYRDEEIPAAMHRIADHPSFQSLSAYLYPGVPLAEVQQQFRNIRTVRQFQLEIMEKAIQTIVAKSMRGFTCHGLERLDPEKRYLFVSNHRDILLDSALLQIALVARGMPTTEITFGSNLMQGQLVIDIGKSNKMFKVIRGGNPRDFYHHSVHLSHYIRHTLLEKKESVWIAQRNGRTKDGHDATDQGLVKMFSLSGGPDVLEELAQLNIVPVAISYQYETCDNLKARELYLSREQKYIKAPGEDLHSILAGVTEEKGFVHMEVMPPLERTELARFRQLEKNEVITAIARLIDQRIYQGFRLWNTNYIAWDMLYHTFDYADRYTSEEYRAFAARMHERIGCFEGNQIELMDLFLKIYANPVGDHKPE